MTSQMLIRFSSSSVLMICTYFILTHIPSYAQQQFQDFNPLLDVAVFSDEMVNLRGSARILGSVASNSTQQNSVILNSWAHPNSIDGNLSIGKGGNPSTVISSVNPNSVGGSILNLPSVRSYPLPDFPAFPSKDVLGSSINLSGNASQTITPADFSGKFIPSIRIRSNTNLTIDLDGSHHVLYVGDLRVEQGHIRFVNAGSLIILVENDLMMGGSSTINQNGSTEQLFMFYEGSGEVNFAGNTRFMGSLFASQANVRIGASNGIMGHVITGGNEVTISGDASAISRVVYAPNAEMKMTGSAKVRGAIVTKSFKGEGNIRVYYEGSLEIEIPDLSSGSAPVLADIEGFVHNDANGLTNSEVDGDFLTEIDGQPLFAFLIDQTNTIVAEVQVKADGSFMFTDVPEGDFSVLLSIHRGVVGEPAPLKELTGRWLYVSDRAGNGASAENNFGSINLTIVTTDITGVRFGIQQRPKATGSTLPATENPGSDSQFLIPDSAFSGSDADGGSIQAIRIPQFPRGTETLIVNGSDYTMETFPATGIFIPANASGNPQYPVEISPFDGNVVVSIPFHTIDDAKSESEEAAVVKVEFLANSTPVSNTFPASGFGTVAFEDSWPGKGDYDFNDVVVDFQFQVESNTANYIERIKASFVLRAFGAGYQNGFGFQILGSIQNSDVLSVSGYNLTENFIELNGNGTEAGQSHPTIIVFDNAFNEIEHPGVGIGVNTDAEAPFMQPATYSIIIEISPNTYTISDMKMADFNPFIFVNLEREHEVHLPGYPPTDLANFALFGERDDASNPAQNRTYVTSNNLPWAIQTYERFEYPIEKQDIIWAHLKFIEWAESGGVLFPDWYKNEAGYRNRALIYKVE